MRWRTSRRSQNVEDRRGMRAVRRPAVAGGGVVLVIVVIALLLGADPGAILQLVGGAGETTMVQTGQTTRSPEEDVLADFATAVLGETEDVWRELFRQSGRVYSEPTLVLYSGAAQSACGYGSAAMGPFYCPGDYKVYLDLGFFNELNSRFGAPGDFASAYVIAHEVGHHVQNLMGLSERMQTMRGRVSKEEYNQLSVRMELQADFLAGVWAHHAERSRAILEKGDIEEALGAAAAIGDDRIQRRSQGYVVPESFTHGTSAQRARWFRLGLETGDLSRGDTFGASTL
ncbi:MAG: neutral zinc metallopeptidase [Bacteroidota bacterium]